MTPKTPNFHPTGNINMDVKVAGLMEKVLIGTVWDMLYHHWEVLGWVML